jgi:hypothetical protein
VGLCGTISTGLVAHGSGTNGHPITIVWQPGASLSSPDWNGGTAFDTNDNRYLTLDGGSGGSIVATAEGTGLAGQGVASIGVNAVGCTGCTIEHLTIANLYQHTSPSDTSVDQTRDNAIKFSGSNLTIAHNTIHDVGWALYAIWANGDANMSIHGNTISDTDHAFASTSLFAGGSIGPLAFYDNTLRNYANWDTGDDAYHHDGIHCYTSDNGAGPSHYAGFYIYDNTFGGNNGANMTAQIFVEGGTGSGSTPCADASSPIWVFNNVASVSRGVDNGVFGIFSGDPRVLNNTLIGSDTSSGVGLDVGSDVPPRSVQVLNNVVSTANQLIVGTSNVFAPTTPNHNIYADGGTNSFVCSHSYYSFGEFGRWQQCVNADRHSVRLRTPVTPQHPTPALRRGLHVGLNLTDLCMGHVRPLCFDIVGRPRRTRGAWLAGAY